MANYNKLYQWVLRIANPQLVYAGLQIQRDKVGYYMSVLNERTVFPPADSPADIWL